jgi:hypothetical protein
VTRTRPILLVLYAVFGGAAGWLLEISLSAMGSPVVMLPYTLAVALVIIGGLVLLFALPVRRAVRDRASQRIDPFYATRVVVLAKATSIAGALLGGAALGILVFFLTRAVVPGVGSIFMSIATAVGAVVLLICGLVAEHMCSLPPDDPEKGEENPVSARPH